MDIEAIRIRYIPGSLNLDTPYGQACSSPIHGVPGRIANGDLVKGEVVSGGGDHFRIIFIDGFLWLIDLCCNQVPPSEAGPVVHDAVSSSVQNAVSINTAGVGKGKQRGASIPSGVVGATGGDVSRSLVVRRSS